MITIGAALTVVTVIVIPIVLWGYKLDTNLTSMRDNHLKHIEANTSITNDRLIEIATILRERHDR